MGESLSHHPGVRCSQPAVLVFAVVRDDSLPASGHGAGAPVRGCRRADFRRDVFCGTISHGLAGRHAGVLQCRAYRKRGGGNDGAGAAGEGDFRAESAAARLAMEW